MEDLCNPPFKGGSVTIACVTSVFISQSTVEVREDIALLRYRHCSCVFSLPFNLVLFVLEKNLVFSSVATEPLLSAESVYFP